MVDASGGTLLFKDKGQWVDFPYQAFKLTSNLTPNRVDSRLDFDGGKLGQLMLSARINPLLKANRSAGVPPDRAGHLDDPSRLRRW